MLANTGLTSNSVPFLATGIEQQAPNIEVFVVSGNKLSGGAGSHSLQTLLSAVQRRKRFMKELHIVGCKLDTEVKEECAALIAELNVQVIVS